MMIKGVNHQMIEVTQTGSPFFERALLVLRADCTDTSPTRLEEEARRMLRTTGGYTALRRNRRREQLRRLAWTLTGVLLGALIGYLMNGGLPF